ncbi:MAG: HEAT repeat domain-containing protein, partial [Cyanobacteriota bacterium]|nr:HEAT repeat domain-containing protein [Cyanobacteriota bacterium]
KYQVDFTCIEFRTKYNHHTNGTKPNQPVSLPEAEKIFYRFIRDKKKRGYVDVFQTSDDSMSITQPFFDDVERKRVILERLENKKPSKWKLDRAIWRAGELKIKEATPLLINLLGTGEDLRDYCIAWSLGWCGDRSTIPVLTELYENPQTPEFVSRIAFEAILKLADEGTKATLQADLISSLPLELGRLARTTSQEIFEQFAINHPSYFFQVFEKIYQIDNPYIRPSILKILRTVPFQPNYFRSIRRIFKIAEYRLDAEVFAILAYRFERVMGNFNNNLLTLTPYEEDEEEKTYQLDNRRVYDDELKKPYPIVAYSYQTQQYFRRRIWRTLKRLGENGDANYIKMATAILLEYSDNDDGVVVRSQFSQWNNFTRDIKQYWDKYADYLTFNHILYSNSPRFFFNSKKWFPRRGCDVNAETTVREEAFPRLWEQYPQELLKLLLESQCLAVHRFAVKVLRDCEDFCSEIDIDVVIQLVYSRFDITAAFGFELALERFELKKSNSKLILLLTNRLFQLHSRPELLSENINLVANLITNPQPNFRKFICHFIQTYELESKTAYRLAMRLIHELSRLENNQQEIITDITDLLVGKYDLISKIPIENIKNLSFFDSTRKCGGKLLLLILERLRSNPENLIEVAELLKYYWGDVDELATEIFYTKITIESFTPNVLIQICKINSGDEGKNLLNRYFLYIRDLTIENREFYISQVQELINILVSIDKYHYTYGWFIELLKEDLLLCKGTVDKNIVLKILQAQTIELQQLGVSVINTEFHHFYNILTNKEIILLANHNLNTIRKTALETLLNRILDNQYTIHEIFLPLTNLLNSNWEDTRWISAEILSSEIDIEEFNTNLILRIIENEKGDVIQLGKTLLTRYLKSIYQKVTENQVLSIQTAKEFIQILLIPEKREDIYSYIVTELERYLKGWINSIDKQTLIKLLQSENSS